MSLFLQIFVAICFAVVIIALFRERVDFLSYTIAAMFAAVVATVFLHPEPLAVDDFILAIEWEVIFFLISIFAIVEVLDDKKIFQEIALRITHRFSTNTRKFFWIICLVSTLSAAFIEDVSVAIIFIPMVIKTGEKLKINPAPILMGVTICINLAATLTPFGSAQNILIATEFGLSTTWFFLNLGVYFIIGTLSTLFLLDRFVLKHSLKDMWVPHCAEFEELMEEQELQEHELEIVSDHIDPKVFQKNLVGLLLFFVLLIVIPNIIFVGILGLLIFIFINPRKNDKGQIRVDVSHYLAKVDFKLVFFFISLFILVFCMEVNGTIKFLEELVKSVAPNNLFLLCVFILITTSLLSGFLDNVPVTILFIPITQALVGTGYAAVPLLIAFILGINLGGNIFPQGSAADMMTLEISERYCVDDMNYRRLLKIGGLFALFHIALGIGYLWILTTFFYT